MTYYSIQSPYEVFTDLNGKPLEDGYIYIGEANQNPITNPITVTWDVDGLYPAAQPIRTINGYPDRNGSPAKMFVNISDNADYSILVQDKHSIQVYYSSNAIRDSQQYGSTVDQLSDLRILNSANNPVYVRSYDTLNDRGNGDFEWIDGAAPGTYTDDDGNIVVPTGGDGSGAFIRQYKNGVIDVRDFGAKGGSTDDTAAIQAAIDSLPAEGGCIVFPFIVGSGGYYTVTDQIDIVTSAVTLRGDRPANKDSVKILFDGTLDATKSIFYCSELANDFSMHDLHLDANSKAGYCLYQLGQHSPTLLTRPGDYQNLTFSNYYTKAWVIGDHTDVLNSAQFQVINARNIFLLGGALNQDADGIHLNAQNCEFMNIFGIYIDPPSAGNHHRNHFRQIAGGLNINGMLSTRSGTTTLLADYAVYSSDQLIIRGWRSEDRRLINSTSSTVRAPVSIQDVIQRDVSSTATTAGTDQNIILNQTNGTVKLSNIQLQGSIAMGATTARRISAKDIYFDVLNAAGTKGGFIYNGPQNQRGVFHDFDTGQIALRGTTPSYDFTEEDGTIIYGIRDGSLFAPRVNVAQITSDPNAFDPGAGHFFRLTSDIAGRTIQGILADTSTDSGRMMKFANVGGNNIIIQHQGGGALQTYYRVICVTGADITLGPNEVAELIYDVATSRWRAWKY